MLASTPAQRPAPPFAAQHPIRSADDVRRLEATPLAEALTVRSTYEIFRNSAAAFGDDRADLPAQRRPGRRARSAGPTRELLAGIHQTANLLHGLGVEPGDAVAVLLPGVPRVPPGAVGRRGGGIVQPLNPLLSDEKLASLMTRGRRPRADRLGRRQRVGHVVEGDAPARGGAHAHAPCCASRRTTRPRAPRCWPRAWSTSTRCAARSAATRWSAAATSRPRTSPPTSTPAAPPARPSSRATATARRCSRRGPACSCRACARATSRSTATRCSTWRACCRLR